MFINEIYKNKNYLHLYQEEGHQQILSVNIFHQFQSPDYEVMNVMVRTVEVLEQPLLEFHQVGQLVPAPPVMENMEISLLKEKLLITITYQP